MKLVIVESPAKCKKIEGFLGDGYKCMASMGHFREIKGLSSIDIPNKYRITFTEMTDSYKKRTISALKKAKKESEQVILATDDDREGEAIAWHLCELLKLDVEKTPRIIFHEITKPAVLEAIKTPTYVNMNVVMAQQCRQVIDLLVGFKVSPVLWKRLCYSKDGALSAGRCQTPALRLVYDNDKLLRENESKETKQKMKVKGLFTRKNIEFELNAELEKEQVIPFLHRSSKHEHIFSRGELFSSKKKPPLPLTTSRVQQLCSNELGISPKITMQCCQKLYEGGFITYMRTDSMQYSSQFLGTVKKYIESTYNDNKYVSPRLFSLTGKSSTSTSTPHESIRPTNIRTSRLPESAKLTGRESKVYRLIWETTLGSCMSESEYVKYTSNISCPVLEEEPKSEKWKYSHTSFENVFMGWEIVKNAKKKDLTSPCYSYLKTLEQNTKTDYSIINAEGSISRSGSHYTEAKLVQLLEEKGIGRPSTFSSLVDKIQEREYVKKMNVDGKTHTCDQYKMENGTGKIIHTTKECQVGAEKNKLVLQPLGATVVEYLIEHFSELFDYEYTSHMEDSLEIVASGEKIWTDPCDMVLETIERTISGIPQEKTKKMEIPIDDMHTYIMGKYGPVVKCVDKTNPDKKKGTSFKEVRPDIDLEKLYNGELSLEEIVKIEDPEDDSWVFDGVKATVKKGKFGLYVAWGDKNISLKGFGNRPPENLKQDEIFPILEKHKNGEYSSIVRSLTDEISVRTGKTGALYVFFKRATMKKPKFLKLPKGVTKENLATHTDTELTEMILEKIKD